MGVAGQSVRTRCAVESHIVDARQHAVDQSVAQFGDARAVVFQTLDRDPRRGGHRDGTGDIGCARTDIAFLTTAME